MNPMEALHSMAGQAKGMRMSVGGPTSLEPGSYFRKQEAYNYINPGHGQGGKDYFKYGASRRQNKKRVAGINAQKKTNKIPLNNIFEVDSSMGTLASSPLSSEDFQKTMVPTRKELNKIRKQRKHEKMDKDPKNWPKRLDRKGPGMPGKPGGKPAPHPSRRQFEEPTTSPVEQLRQRTQNNTKSPSIREKNHQMLADRVNARKGKNKMVGGRELSIGVAPNPVTKPNTKLGPKYGSFSGMSKRGKAIAGIGGVVAGGLAWGQASKSKDSPVMTGLMTGGMAAGATAAIGAFGPAAARMERTAGRRGNSVMANKATRMARKVGWKKAGMVAGGVAAGLGIARNITGI